MTKIYRHIFILALLLPLLTGCKEDDLFLEAGQEEFNGELPVEFILSWPGDIETRGFDGVPVKTKFQDQDVIHIVGTFNTNALQEDGSYKTGIVSRYGALKYNGKTREWEAVAGNRLTWPSIATDGEFYAYYVSGANGLFTEFDTPVTVSLSEVTPEGDPLMAPPTGYLKYGHAVNLQFNHLCAYLTLIDLEPVVASDYFFTTDEVKDFETGATRPFNNAFELSLVQNDGSENPDLSGDPALQFKFIQIPDPTFDDLIFISGKTYTSEMTDSDGETINATRVSYFLEPGYYETFQLKYPSTAPNTYQYLTYDYKDIPTNVGGTIFDNTPPDLKAGIPYTLTVTKSPGITIDSPSSGEGWDDETPSVKVNVPSFLEAVRDGKEYKNEDGTVILEKTADGVMLLHNVDFNFFSYSEFTNLNFLPDLPEGKVFDGNYKTISNLGAPLLRNNYGTITDLGIKNIIFEATSYEAKSQSDEIDNTKDRSRHGALCMWNRSNATVSNVRVENVEMKVNVTYDNADDDGNEVHNVGCVVGSNTGKINELLLGGAFSLTVTGTEVQNAEILIGGITGQNAGNGTIYDVSLVDDDFTMNIRNTCTGDLGLYSIGGIVGRSSGYITGVILSDVTIDSTLSSGVDSYIGGMAGVLEVTGANSNGYLNSCIVSGNVKAGMVAQSGAIPGQAYTGGMVGYDSNIPVTDCRASVGVTGSSTVGEGVLYGTGGAFGRIQNASTFENLIAYGGLLVAPGGVNNSESNYIGNFAGIGPANQSWNDNYANNNIILHQFGTLPNIGIFLQ